MTVIVEQTPDMTAGTARLERPASGALDPATLRIDVSTPDGRKHLDPSREGAAAWASGERWFAPDHASMDGETLVLKLGPSVTWHLEPHHPYRIGFRDGANVRIDDRASWIPMRLPSRPPVPAPSIPPREEPEPETEPPREAGPEPAEDSAPEPPERTEAPVDAPAPAASAGSSRKRRRIVLPAAAALLLALAAVLWIFFGDRDAPPASPEEGAEESSAPSSGPPPDAEAEDADPPPAAAAPSSGPEVRPPLARGSVRVFLKEKPSAAQALEEAERSRAAGEEDASFLLVKYAAREGSAEAARRMGSYYDPATHSPEAGVIAAPDPAAAADWYERAAKAGDAGAMIRLAEMLEEKLLDAPDAPERRIFWLRKAAEAGSEQAKGLLER